MQQQMYRVNHIHFIGIGGVGMCGIAEVLAAEGYTVSGSDLNESVATTRLRQLGIKVYIGHQESNITAVDVVVVSSAITADNDELLAAKRLKIPVVQRAAMLAELMRFRFGVAIAGTHGKTTTTSLCASLLNEAGLDPTFVIGGQLISAETNARLGTGRYLVAEADESDASFLHLSPMLSVVTNVDADHLENYGGQFDQVKQTFIEFIHNMPFYGLAILCFDDPGVQSILPDLARPVLTYGYSEGADVVVRDYAQNGIQTDFTLHFNTRHPLRLSMNLPGKHNVLNATAAVLVALELGVEEPHILDALAHFQGVGRRFQRYEDLNLLGRRVHFVDDYAHHPNELSALLATVKATYPGSRLILAFQPHRYSRTLAQFDHFSEVLSAADELVLLEVYPAGESPIAGADSHALAQNIRKRCTLDPLVVSSEEAMVSALGSVLVDGDVLVTAGAGSIGKMAATLPGALTAVTQLDEHTK